MVREKPIETAYEANAKKIQAELTKLINEGYEIKSNSVGGDYLASTTIIILTK